jgi:hypothetical protein
MDANDVLALGLGVTPPWKLVGQRLDTSTQPNQLARVATNNGAHVFPYGPMAAAALDGIPRHLDRPYLFPTARNAVTGRQHSLREVETETRYSTHCLRAACSVR